MKIDHLINGKTVAGRDYFETVNPATQGVLAEVASGTEAEVNAAVQAAFGVNGAAPTDPASAAFATYYASYHGTYVPPLCHAQARAVFDTVR